MSSSTSSYPNPNSILKASRKGLTPCVISGTKFAFIKKQCPLLFVLISICPKSLISRSIYTSIARFSTLLVITLSSILINSLLFSFFTSLFKNISFLSTLGGSISMDETSISVFCDFIIDTLKSCPSIYSSTKIGALYKE